MSRVRISLCLAVFLFAGAARAQESPGPLQDETRRQPSSGTEAQKKVRPTPARASGIVADNLDRVAATANQILEIVNGDAGLMVELKRVLAEDAGESGQILEESEDLAILRSLPRMTVVAPGDPVETEAATRAVTAHAGPCYLRLGRAGEAKIHQTPIGFVLGKAIQMRDGKDVTLISTGEMLGTAMRVADLLEDADVQARVLSMHTVKPLDTAAIERAALETGAVVTLEEHSIVGGLGGAVAEFLAENWEAPLVFKRFGLPLEFSSFVGSQEYMRARHGLSAEALALAIRAQLARVPRLTAAARV
jgi:transketolase C-terminal domain/subunit